MREWEFQGWWVVFIQTVFISGTQSLAEPSPSKKGYHGVSPSQLPQATNISPCCPFLNLLRLLRFSFNYNHWKFRPELST